MSKASKNYQVRVRTAPGEHTLMKVRCDMDFARILEVLAAKAFKNTSKRTSEMGGLLTVKILGQASR